MNELPSAQEFVKELEKSLNYCLDADDMGSVHFEMARWQEWIKAWPQILTPEGGI